MTVVDQLQLPNAPSLIDLTALGMTMPRRDEHSLNAYFRITSTPSPRVSVVNPEHLWNARIFIVLTALGMMMFSSLRATLEFPHPDFLHFIIENHDCQIPVFVECHLLNRPDGRMDTDASHVIRNNFAGTPIINEVLRPFLEGADSCMVRLWIIDERIRCLLLLFIWLPYPPCPPPSFHSR